MTDADAAAAQAHERLHQNTKSIVALNTLTSAARLKARLDVDQRAGRAVAETGVVELQLEGGILREVPAPADGNGLLDRSQLPGPY